MQREVNIMPKIDFIDTKPTDRDIEFAEWLEYLTQLVCSSFKITPEQLNFTPMEKQQYEKLKQLEKAVKEGKATFQERNVYNIIQKKKRKKQPIKL